MSLKEARRFLKRLKAEGQPATIVYSIAACDAHNPKRHRMCGNYAVRAVGNGIPDGIFLWPDKKS